MANFDFRRLLVLATFVLIGAVVGRMMGSMAVGLAMGIILGVVARRAVPERTR
ncbi:MAG TPA: hypothetical protein VFH27_08840 [Longimicrobiaceae bacterium]|nr:hypothetical protein [Longimicrobiaceae bacterium]